MLCNLILPVVLYAVDLASAAALWLYKSRSWNLWKLSQKPFKPGQIRGDNRK